MRKPKLQTHISNILRERIRQGVYTPYMRLPGHLRLAREFGVSSITSNRALKMLRDEGLIFRNERNGSYVSPVSHQLRRVVLVLSPLAHAGILGSIQLSGYLKGVTERVAELKLESAIQIIDDSDQ